MKWVSFFERVRGGPVRIGIVEDGVVFATPARRDLLTLVAQGAERLVEQGEDLRRRPAERFALDAVRLLPPVPRPPAIRDFYAFEEHVRTARAARGLDMEPDWYALPVFYFSNPGAVVGPDAAVAAPPDSAELDYELEVAAVVGPGGSDLTVEEAGAHIAGYTIMNDWSARDLQRREMRVGLGPAKGKDFATSLGPWLVTPDELAAWHAPGRKAPAVAMRASVNGREYSRGSLGDVHWSFAEMLAYASRGASVSAGDVIGSGTCGTGCILELSLVHGADAYPWLRPGDRVTLEVDGLGQLANVVAPPA